jgi:hypothetical protein
MRRAEGPLRGVHFSTMVTNAYNELVDLPTSGLPQTAQAHRERVLYMVIGHSAREAIKRGYRASPETAYRRAQVEMTESDRVASRRGDRIVGILGPLVKNSPQPMPVG